MAGTLKHFIPGANQKCHWYGPDAYNMTNCTTYGDMIRFIFIIYIPPISAQVFLLEDTEADCDGKKKEIHLKCRSAF